MRVKPVDVPEVPGTVEVEVSPDGIVFHGTDGPLRTLLFKDISLLDTHDPTWKRIVGCRDWFAKPNPKFYLRTGPDSPRWLFEPPPGTAITLVMPADDYRPWDEFQSALYAAGVRTLDLG